MRYEITASKSQRILDHEELLKKLKHMEDEYEKNKGKYLVELNQKLARAQERNKDGLASN